MNEKYLVEIDPKIAELNTLITEGIAAYTEKDNCQKLEDLINTRLERMNRGEKNGNEIIDYFITRINLYNSDSSGTAGSILTLAYAFGLLNDTTPELTDWEIAKIKERAENLNKATYMQNRIPIDIESGNILWSLYECQIQNSKSITEEYRKKKLSRLSTELNSLIEDALSEPVSRLVNWEVFNDSERLESIKQELAQKKVLAEQKMAELAELRRPLISYAESEGYEEDDVTYLYKKL